MIIEKTIEATSVEVTELVRTNPGVAIEAKGLEVVIVVDPDLPRGEVIVTLQGETAIIVILVTIAEAQRMIDHLQEDLQAHQVHPQEDLEAAVVVATL